MVESEKTAIVASIFCPSFLWIASGGATGITPKKAEILKGREVWLVVDSDPSGRDGYLKASKVLTKAGVQNKVKDLFPDRNDKTDLCDYIIAELQKLNTPQPPQPPETAQISTIPPTASNNTIPKEISENQAFNKLLTVLDLEVINIKSTLK